MHGDKEKLDFHCARLMRRAFLSLLSALVVEMPPEQLHRRFLALPLPEQALLVSATALALLLTAVLLAEAGPGGPLALPIAVWVLMR